MDNISLDNFNLRNIRVCVDYQCDSTYDGDIYYIDEYVTSFTEVPVHGDVFECCKDGVGNPELFTWLWQHFYEIDPSDIGYIVDYLFSNVEIEYKDPYQDQENYKYHFIQTEAKINILDKPRNSKYLLIERSNNYETN